MNTNIHNMIPVLLVRGFLEAGKTTLINRILREDALCRRNILFLSCEEGEVPADPDLCTKYPIHFIALEDKDQLNQAYLEQLSAACQPSLVIIECNVMWKMVEFELPRSWRVTRRIAVLCAPTIGLYMNNLRSFMGPMLSRCDEIIINRCDPGPDLLSPIKASLRPLLDDISRVRIESRDGSYPFDSIKDILPYALDTDILNISDQDYVVWFYDCQDHPKRYDGKKIALNADVKKSPILKNNEFALGRLAVTCCEADMSFLGYLAQFDQIDKIPQYSRVYAEGIVTYRYLESYQKVMPYLKITYMESRNSNEEMVTFQ